MTARETPAWRVTLLQGTSRTGDEHPALQVFLVLDSLERSFRLGGQFACGGFGPAADLREDGPA